MSLLGAVEAGIKLLTLFLLVSLLIVLLLGGAHAGYTVEYANGTRTVVQSAPVEVAVKSGARGSAYTLNLTIHNHAQAPVNYVLVKLSCKERMTIPVWLPDPLPPNANTTLSILLPRPCEQVGSKTVEMVLLADGTLYMKR